MVREVDFSANDMTAKGLECFGNAVAAGALHSLESLNLCDCSGLLTLPDALAQLHMLQTLKLDGCIGLTSFPQCYSQMAALKVSLSRSAHCLSPPPTCSLLVHLFLSNPLPPLPPAPPVNPHHPLPQVAQQFGGAWRAAAIGRDHQGEEKVQVA